MADKPDINVVLNFKKYTPSVYLPNIYKRDDTFAEKVLKFFPWSRGRTPGKLVLCVEEVERRFANPLNKQRFMLHITNTYDGRPSTRKVRLKRYTGEPNGKPYLQMYNEPNENIFSSWGYILMNYQTSRNIHRYLVSKGYTIGDTLFIRVTYY